MRLPVVAIVIVFPLIGCSRSPELGPDLLSEVQGLRTEVTTLRSGGVLEPPVFDFASATKFENELLRVLGQQFVDTTAFDPDDGRLQESMHKALVKLDEEARAAQGPLRDRNFLRRSVNDLDWSTLPTTKPRILAEIAGHRSRIRRIEEKKKWAPRDNPFYDGAYETLLRNHSDRLARLQQLTESLQE